MTGSLSDVHSSGKVQWVASIFREIRGPCAADAALGNSVSAVVFVSTAWCGRSATTAPPTGCVRATVRSPVSADYELSCLAATDIDLGWAGSSSR
jgi:hypothetical protein